MIYLAMEDGKVTMAPIEKAMGRLIREMRQFAYGLGQRKTISW